MLKLLAHGVKLAALVGILVSSPALAQPPPIRIMPLGDSITYGSSVAGGYRLPLYVALTNAGYNVDFIGTQAGNSDPGLGTEVNHEGHGGWKISDPNIGLYEKMYGWFEQIQDPHVVLIHIGTNDSGGGDLFTNAYVRLEALVDRIATCQPSAKIILTTLLKRTSNYAAITNYFNPRVPEVVAHQQSLGHTNVVFLDMHAYLELTDLADGVHPNAGGYIKMGNAWFPSITNVISPGVVANQPAPLRGLGVSSNRTTATVSFNKAVSPDTATNMSNYAIDGGLTITAASLSANHRTVTLATSEQEAGTTYTVTMNSIEDETTPTALSIPADSQVTFDSPAAPTLVSASGAADHLHVSVTYSKTVSPGSATNTANYAIDGGLSVLAASISGDHLTVTLTTDLQTEGTSYTITVNNVQDETTPTPLTIAADSTVSFVADIPRGYSLHVPESANYTLVYSLDLPNTAYYNTSVPAYSTNNSAIVGPFSRVAYYLELQKTGEALQYLWVSMDAFTNRADKLGIPTFASGVVYQQTVNNMNVICNVPGVSNGVGLATGNIEFWPWNYGGVNAIGIPNASGSLFDFGDQCSFNSGNYGCMQVHNWGASQTLFALNHWNGANIQVGIGNDPAPTSGGLDWTFHDNGSTYAIKTLQVLVLCDPAADTTPPTPLSAQAGFTRRQVTVTFDELLAPSSVDGTRFALDHGVEVLSASPLSDGKSASLITTEQPLGTTLTLTVDGIRDLACNPVPAGTTITVTEPGPPAEVVANAGALSDGYQLVYALDIPVKGNFNASPNFYSIDQSAFTGAFDRVAYYVELEKMDGTVQYLWASMDALTANPGKIGVPTLASGAVFQCPVSNLDVKSNVAGVSNGVAMTGGNLEFWPYNYSAPNAAGVPNASSTAYDFGDQMDPGSHGSMQIHNAGLSQTLFAMNNWGADGQLIALGIGTRTTSHPDWTFANNAGTDYKRRTLYVLVRPGPTIIPLPPEVEANVPAATGYQLAYTIDLPVTGSFNTNSPAYYTVNNVASRSIANTFTRVGYYLELQAGSSPTQWIWTAMDAFTTDARKLGVPTNNCYFQQSVANLQVRSNVDGIETGDGIATGNLEFWPSSYSATNTFNIPGASHSSYDWGDSAGSGSSIGYGSMQVHNYGATQTLFAVNNFNNNSTLCIGIGNRPGQANTDWTSAVNAGSYNHRRLHVFVLPGGESDVTAPTLIRANASRSLDQVALLFSETVADTASTASLYTLNNGAAVTAASLQADKRTVILTTSALTAGQTYIVSVTGVRDRSSAGNLIAAGSTASFTAPSGETVVPNVLTNVAETAGYKLVHQLAIGDTVSWASGCNYAVDESRFAQTQAFDRVAYCLEVVTNGQYKWAYVSMDAFTTDLTKIGVPTADRGALWQQYVSNLNVFASENVANTAVTTGVFAAGNIEFWPSNYGASNDKSIPGASGSAFDFGDGGGPSATSAGHGSMQVHNYALGHTIFALNSFGTNGRTPCIGIGNNTFFTNGANQDPDWTFYYNARQYTTKNLYVLVRFGAPPASSGTPPAIWSQPRSQTVYLHGSARMSVYAPGATAYQWRKNGALIPGATRSWLEFDPSEASDDGVYDVIVTGASGYTTSAAATLEVIPYTQPQAPNTLRIMPLGDSITYGSGTAGGYRLPLYIALTNAGYKVDYVGTRTDNSAAGLGAEINHEGLSGWTIDGINNNIIDFLYPTDDPDVVLLHIGTNDSGATDFSNRIDRLDALVSRIATNRPNANIVVTTLLKRSDLTRYAAITNYFNPYVEGKVLAQRALGRKVHFLDMHAYLELTDLYDGLHPNAGGYQKMANAWFPVITNIVSVYGDASAPALARAVNLPTLDGVQAIFSKAMDPETATNLANYAMSGGVTITGATLSGDQRTVTLATSALTRDATYTLTVNAVKDYSWPVQQTIEADSADDFRATVRGYLANVPESAGYRLAYALDIPNAPDYDGTTVAYSTNNTDKINQPLSRIAYYLELQPLDGDLTYAWVSMDAFTADVTKIGVPAKYTGAVYQQTVGNMNIVCNDPGVTTGTGIATGNIEFWPFDYGGNNTASIPGASTTLCDFGDERRTTGNYACMQVHNYGAAQTVFSFNHWNAGGQADLGIGNQPAGQPDWTFSYNGNAYPVRSLYVLVTTGSDTTPPTLVSAQAGSAGTLVTVTFSEPLLSESVDGNRFSLDYGVSVVSARLLADRRTAVLGTTPQPTGQTLTLTVTGVRDAGGINPIAPGSTITVAPAALPPEVTANAGALADGYELVYALDIPTKGTFNGTPDFYRYDQSGATGAFDRIAYYMELVKADATTQYVWTAMDAFTAYRKQTGVPTVSSKAVFQQYVQNLDVKSNVSGVTAGTSMSNGNIEFWPGSYSAANALGIVNASASYYDWGDTRTSSGAGYGSMQVHNAGLSQVLFALNDFGTDGNTLDVGIGNRTDSSHRDWTQIYNAGNFASRKLYVMVRPAAPAQASDLPAEIAANVSSDLTRGYQLVCSITNIPVKGTFNDTTWAATNYVVDRRSLLCSNSFRRIAYYLELQTATDAVPRYVWTSMDAFTIDPAKIGIPLAGTLFQQKVSNLDVACNVSSVATGTGISTGNIEFWPGNYNQSNAINIPNANGGTFDFGDGGASSTTGHGCMQVHNYGAQQTIWAINHFNLNNPIGAGIGNGPSSGDPDYTFTYNAGNYTRSIFHVLVLPGGETDTEAPALSSALASRALNQVFVTFTAALSDSAASDGTFALNNGATVTSAALAASKTGIVLDTSLLTAGQTYTLTVSGVRDRSSSGNRIADNSTVSFTAPSAGLPPVLANIAETGDYTLIHQLAVSNNVYWVNGCDYSVDESRFPQSAPFDRIAYCMELTGTNGVAQWVYVSMDAFTADLTKIGVPSPDRGEIYQQYVSNLIICASANVAGATVVTGQVASGNIEFWPNDYSAGNALSIPGASASAYDFGDTRSSGGSYGSMQIHNFAAAQTIFSMCHFGGSGFRPCMGIGNQPSGSPDWTFNENANTYSVKNLYVMVRRSGTAATGNGPNILTQPQSVSLRSGLSAVFSVVASDATAYQWRLNGVWIPGATQPWLEVASADMADEGLYDVIVYGAGGATLSDGATLHVYSAGTRIIFK